jgi:hypothetical protein
MFVRLKREESIYDFCILVVFIDLESEVIGGQLMFLPLIIVLGSSSVAHIALPNTAAKFVAQQRLRWQILNRT